MNHIQELVTELGYDTSNEELTQTPSRSYSYFKKYTKKTDQDFSDFCLSNNIKSTYSKKTKNIKISLQNISVHSICQHHLLPFYGHAYISYVSNGHTLGLSKFKRLIDYVSSEFTTQEHLTQNIASHIMAILPVKSLYITLECTHSCMIVRGVKDINSYTTTETHFHEDKDDVSHSL